MSIIDHITEKLIEADSGPTGSKLFAIHSNEFGCGYRDTVVTILKHLREPTHAITRAMAESRATDDEGPLPIMLDLLDFSGENKTHTVLAQAWRDGIDAILRDG